MTKLLVKIIAFSGLVIVLQAVVTAVFPPKTPREVRLLNRYLEERVDIIYFGDSTVHHFAESDRNKNPISLMLQDRLPGYSVGKVAGAAYNMDLYERYVAYIVARGAKPRLIVIPINLRSFSPEWDQRPEYQFEKEKLFLTLAPNFFHFLFYRPISVFSNLQPIQEQDYRESPVYEGFRQVGVVREFDNPSFRAFSREKTTRKLILRYMASLDGRHRKVQSMLRIVRMAKENGLSILFYITPIDYRTGNRHLGSVFAQRIGENARFIRSLLEVRRGAVLDLSLTLDSPAFNFGHFPDDHLYPNEHLKEQGRRYVAAALS